MEESLEKLSKQGSITEESKDAMVEESGKLEQLLVTKAELDDIDNDDLHPGKQETLDYKEEIDKLLKRCL